MMDWCDRLFNQHKFVRRVLVIWAVWLITWVVIQVFSHLDKVSASVATALATVVGILATVLAFYQWSRDKDSGNQ